VDRSFDYPQWTVATYATPRLRRYPASITWRQVAAWLRHKYRKTGWKALRRHYCGVSAATRNWPETATKLPAGGHENCPLTVVGSA
jgi:hypothetical protein